MLKDLIVTKAKDKKETYYIMHNDITKAIASQGSIYAQISIQAKSVGEAKRAVKALLDIGQVKVVEDPVLGNG